jgi:hypothetical protein
MNAILKLLFEARYAWCPLERIKRATLTGTILIAKHRSLRRT